MNCGKDLNTTSNQNSKLSYKESLRSNTTNSQQHQPDNNQIEDDELSRSEFLTSDNAVNMSKVRCSLSNLNLSPVINGKKHS